MPRPNLFPRAADGSRLIVRTEELERRLIRPSAYQQPTQNGAPSGPDDPSGLGRMTLTKTDSQDISPTGVNDEIITWDATALLDEGTGLTRSGQAIAVTDDCVVVVSMFLYLVLGDPTQAIGNQNYLVPEATGSISLTPTLVGPPGEVGQNLAIQGSFAAFMAAGAELQWEIYLGDAFNLPGGITANNSLFGVQIVNRAAS